jgi:hypothetical protein
MKTIRKEGKDAEYIPRWIILSFRLFDGKVSEVNSYEKWDQKQ